MDKDVADPLYESLATEFRDCIESGRYLYETDGSFYKQAGATKGPPTIAEIATDVAEEFNISRAYIFTHIRKNAYFKPRCVAVALVSECLPHLSSGQIGRAFNRDHSTILNTIERAQELAASDPEFASVLKRMREKYSDRLSD